jgi:glycine cleavage system regulatory protein
MLDNLVMTVIGPDRPGLVQQVAQRVADHGGNWLESRMAHLGGQFAGILRVEVDTARADELTSALKALGNEGLQVVLHREGASDAAVPAVVATIDLVGQDRPGILRAVSGVFAAHAVNVEELSSERVSAPMGGGTLFQAKAKVSAPTRETLSGVRGDLEKIAADLVIDLTVEAPRG